MSCPKINVYSTAWHQSINQYINNQSGLSDLSTRPSLTTNSAASHFFKTFQQNLLAGKESHYCRLFDFKYKFFCYTSSLIAILCQWWIFKFQDAKARLGCCQLKDLARKEWRGLLVDEPTDNDIFVTLTRPKYQSLPCWEVCHVHLKTSHSCLHRFCHIKTEITCFIAHFNSKHSY